jgi:hypothetical protein
VEREERSRLIEQYAGGPARLRAAIERTPPAALAWRPAADEFSPHEVVCHCADSETNSHGRIRYLLAEKDPVIVGYDPLHWAGALDYASHPLDAALATVEAVRANTAPLLRQLTEADWAKAGRHTESGAYTAEDWLRIYAAHVDEHVEQIDAAVAAWRASNKAG